MKYFYFLCLALVFNSCIIISNTARYKEFVDTDYPKTNLSLKLNGYYYFEYAGWKSEIGQPSANKVKKIQPIFLYKNGSMKYHYIADAYEWDQSINGKDHLIKNEYSKCHENLIKSLAWTRERREKQVNRYPVWDYNNWGHYKINGNKIRMMYYYRHDGGFRPIEVKGRILNDSTFVLTEKVVNEDRYYDAIYRFYKSNHKPDSLDFMDYINETY